MKILIMLLLISTAFPQQKSFNDAHLELGIKDEMMIMYTSTENINQSVLSLPINFHATAGISFLDHYKIDYRIGLMLVFDDYQGIDQAVFFEADLYKGLYGTLGFDWMNNGGGRHGVMVQL